MANEFAHKTVGSSMTQAEYESIGGHVFDSQATGDIVYATSTSQLSRLGIGSTGAVLTVTGGIPAWDTTWSATGDLVPATDDTYDLGSASAAWQDLFLEGDITFTDAGNITFTPSTDDTVVLTASTNGAFSLVTTDTAAAAANIQITADGTVDIDSAGVLTLDSGAAINIEPASGSAILLDGTISIDAGVVTGATSITSADLTVTNDIGVDGTANLDNTDIDGTLVVDGTNISLDSTATLNIDNSNTSNGIAIGTATSGVPVTIGHATSEVTVGDNLTVTGDLTVSGTTTTVTSTTVAIADSLLLLAKDQGTSADAVDFGIYGKYGDGGTAKYAGIFRDLSATGDPWTFFDELQAEPGATVNTAGTGYDLADISAGAITSADGFAGNLTGNVTGNASGTAATVTGGTQASITATANLVTVGTIGTGVWQGTAIASGYIAADAITGAKIADDAIDSEHYTDGSIDTDHIADNQVTLGKMAGITRGSILIGNSGGDPAALAIGSNTYVLRSDGTDIAWSASSDSDTTYSAGDGLGLSGTTFSTDLMDDGGLEIQSTELSVAQGISQHDVAQFAASVADNDFLRIDGTAVEGRSAAEVLSDIGAGAAAGSGSIVTTGALDSGSITSNFGTINIGASALDTTGAVSTGALSPAGDVAIADAKVVKLGGTRPADDEPASNNTGYGVVVLFDAGAAVAIGDAVSIGTDGRVIKTVADATGTLSGPCIGVATTAAGSADDDVYVMTHGIFRHDDWNFGTKGQAVYVEEADPGDLSLTPPNDDGDYAQRVGVAVTDDVLLVMPSIDVIEHA